MVAFAAVFFIHLAAGKCFYSAALCKIGRGKKYVLVTEEKKAAGAHTDNVARPSLMLVSNSAFFKGFDGQ